MQETPVQAVPVQVETKFYVIPGMYEKWRHPSNKNDKHYRVIFRSNTHLRRMSKRKFKRAFDAEVYATKFDLRLCTRRDNAV